MSDDVLLLVTDLKWKCLILSDKFISRNAVKTRRDSVYLSSRPALPCVLCCLHTCVWYNLYTYSRCRLNAIHAFPPMLACLPPKKKNEKRRISVSVSRAKDACLKGGPFPCILLIRHREEKKKRKRKRQKVYAMLK
jgi:hypothetical protein